MANAHDPADRPLRIAHVVDYLMPPLGYQEWLLPKWCARRGHDVHIVTSERFTPVEDYERTWEPLLGPRIGSPGDEERDGVAVHRLPVRAERRRRIWLRGLEPVLDRIAPDAVFGHGTTTPTAFALANHSRKRNWPLFLDNHMVDACRDRTFAGRIFYAALRLWTRRRLLPAVERFYEVQEADYTFLVEAQGIPKERISFLPLGVDTDLFAPAPEGAAQLRKEQGIPPDAGVVLQTGKLTADKGPDLLACAAARLLAARDGADGRPGAWLAYVGAGPDEMIARIRGLLRDAGAGDRLRILPFVPSAQLAQVYSMADICAYPAAASLSCLEAAACERAVVMADLPSGRWRAECGVGAVYPTGNVEALASLLGRMLDTPDERRAQARKAREVVRDRFSYDAVAARLEADIRAALNV